jgi:cytochrome bd-type quinol oxidase subunit 1
MARRNRLLTIPSGLVLFACIGLPGYRDCEHNTAMREDPFFATSCGLGLLVAIAAMTFVRRRGERAAAITSIVLMMLVVALFALGNLAYHPVFVGMTLGLVATLATLAGAILWEREVRGRSIERALRVVFPVALVAAIATAALSTWNPPPAEHINIAPLLVH